MKTKHLKEQFIKQLPNKNICLLGLQGSRGQGLQVRNDADYDYRGIFIATNKELLSLHRLKETIEVNKQAKDNEAEFVLHEIDKFFRLAMKGNPSVISLLFLPQYNIKTNIGDDILNNRNLFLGEIPIRNAFGGYALSQILYLKRNHKFTKGRKTEEKIAKHIKHCFRLFDQGKELLEKGQITFPVKNPDKYIQISQITDEDKLLKMFEERDREFQACKSILPKQPDEYLINKLLLKIRGC